MSREEAVIEEPGMQQERVIHAQEADWVRITDSASSLVLALVA